MLFSSPAAAVAAQAGADGAIFQGRLLHVLPGRPAPKTEEEGPSDAKSFKVRWSLGLLLGSSRATSLGRPVRRVLQSPGLASRSTEGLQPVQRAMSPSPASPSHSRAAPPSITTSPLLYRRNGREA